MDRWLVFDLDDTLFLERDYVASGFRAVGRYAQAIGLDAFGERCWELFEAGVRGDTFNRVLAEAGRSDAALTTELVRVYREHRPEIALLDDARETLDRVSRSQTGLGLLTGGPTPVQELKVDATNVGHWIETVMLSGQWGPELDKPHPRAFLELQNLLAAPCSALTYIADNPAKDFTAPLDLGWSAVRIRRPGSLHESLDTPSGVPEFEDLSQVT